MNSKNFFRLLSLLTLYTVSAQNIPIEHLSTALKTNTYNYTKTILENEIKGITTTQISITQKAIVESLKDDSKYIYLFIKGNGILTIEDKPFQITPETILLPNSKNHFTISPKENDTLHFLKIQSKLTKQDYLDLAEFPKEHRHEIYFKKFTDCEAYTEPIKSPNTISRTILPNKYIPRIAMGTVQTTGPDKVGAHEHGMLEQLFLGLDNNKVIVYADDAQVEFPEYTLLHIPLGSSHSVTVEEGDTMYYVWMDFFRDKKAEDWLKTHNTIKSE